MKRFYFSLCVLVLAGAAEAVSPTLSISHVDLTGLQVSWPSNYLDWQLMYTPNLSSSNWLPVRAHFLSSNALVFLYSVTNSYGFFRLQQANSGGSGGCAFQAPPPVINPGASSTLTWCPVAGTSYRISPGQGSISGGSLDVSPTNTTVYSLVASNAQGMVTNNTTVIVGPCGWLQVSNWDVSLDILYNLTPSTASYNFNILHYAGVTFHLNREPISSDTDAYYFGFATDDPNPDTFLSEDKAEILDMEVDKTGPASLYHDRRGHGSARSQRIISLLAPYLYNLRF